ncbi:MAG: DUF115 domain-containing protein [Spirochaetaceae bacterium]|nr:MAG: DUF115 domain-containing protein [Spirochaetaceae bacterium]
MNSNSNLLRDQNLEALDRAHPGLADAVRRAGACTDADFAIDTETGVVSLRASGTYVHSARDPYREAIRTIQDVQRSDGIQVIVFFGFGLGYHVEEALRSCHDVHCIVYEPDTALFHETLKWRDLQHVLGSDRLSLFTACPPEQVAMLLRNMHRSQVYAVRLRSLYSRNRAEFEQLDRVIDDTFRRRDVNRATLKRFGRRWVVNLVTNLDVLARARPVAELADLFHGVPAVVLAGGPGLDEVLPVLPELARRCLIIAVDTSLVAALRSGVDPDYTIIVDPQYWNTRHLDLCRNSNSVLVSESSTHPRVFRLLGSQTYMCSSLFPLGRYLEENLGEFGSLGAGGSVSTTAWDFARHLGVSEIFCAGLDLGFPGRNTHFRGSFFEERSLSYCDRLYPTESMAWRYLNSGTPFYTRDFTGSQVLTDERMRVYHWWFENQMSLHPGTKTLNLNPHAVGIPGMACSRPGEILAKPVRRPDIDALIRSKGLRRDDAELTIRRTRIRDRLARLSGQLETLAALCGSALEELSTSQPDLEALDRIDAQIMGVDARDVAGFLVQHAVEDVMLDASLHPIEKSRQIYTHILESIERHKEFLTQENE